LDTESLRCYRFKGIASVIDKGPLHEKMKAEIDEKLQILTVNRIIEGVKSGKGHGSFIVNVSKEFVIFKVKITELIEYGLEDIRKRRKVTGPASES